MRSDVAVKLQTNINFKMESFCCVSLICTQVEWRHEICAHSFSLISMAAWSHNIRVLEMVIPPKALLRASMKASRRPPITPIRYEPPISLLSFP